MALETTFGEGRALEEKKLSPGNLLDHAMSFFGAHGGELAKGLGRFAKDNPVPAALMGIGVVWILLTPKSAGDSERHASGDDDLEDAAAEYTGNRHISKAGEEASDSNLSERVSAAPATRGLRLMAQEQPFLLAALGIALGAAIGALLPESDPERRWFGSARSRTLSKIKEEGEHAYEQVRGATQRAVEDVKQAVWELTTATSKISKNRD